MARVEKNTRIHGLPAKLRINLIEGVSGTMPTVHRTSSDNRTGKYNISFNDTETVIFNSQSNSIVYPILIDHSQPFPSGVLSQNNFELNSNNMITTASQKTGISDIFLNITKIGQEIECFCDSANPASDEKNNSFYVSGSTVETIGPGFNGPLWAKTKLEFNLMPAETVTSSVCISSLSGNVNFPMVYWNNVTKTYEGIGPGTPFDSYGSGGAGILNFFNTATIGFGFTTDNNGYTVGLADYAFYIKGRPITNFGFPYHEKFKATDSQLISMKNYISEPFLLEKIVLYFSASHEIQSVYDSNYGATTFFILNERTGQKQNLITQNLEYSLYGDPLANITTSSLPQEKYRDLVTYMQITKKPVGLSQVAIDGASRELNVDTIFWEGQYIMSGVVKSPLSFERGISNIYSGSYFGNFSEFIEKNNKNGRNQIFDRNARDWLNTFETTKTIGTGTYSTGSPVTRITVSINELYEKPNPYLLFPEDNIIFGWQLPLDTLNQNASKLTFTNSGIHKLIMYGSLIKDSNFGYSAQENHDTLNQNLNSVVVYEVIG